MGSRAEVRVHHSVTGHTIHATRGPVAGCSLCDASRHAWLCQAAVCLMPSRDLGPVYPGAANLTHVECRPGFGTRPVPESVPPTTTD